MAWLSLASLAAFACSEAESAPRSVRDAAPVEPVQRNQVELVLAADWIATLPQDDPLAEHRPDPVECGIAGFYPELEALEIDSGRCNYLAIEQPARHALEQGDPIELSLLHYDLMAEEPAAAHLALAFGDDVVWEQNVPIPRPAGQIAPLLHAPRALAAGEPIRFHLHNHGQNTWLLVGLHARVRGQAELGRDH